MRPASAWSAKALFMGFYLIIIIIFVPKKQKEMADYLDELNDSQREAVLYKDGPALVIAGAGSGKTRVLTYKIADNWWRD